MFSARLTTSAYASSSWQAEGSVHRFTHWVVRRVSDSVRVVENLWDSVNLLVYLTPPVLVEGVSYEALVAHVDTIGYETWSDPVPITAAGLLKPPLRKAWAFTYDGHIFYVLNAVDRPNLVCDLTTGQWHEWRTAGFPYWNMHNGIMWRGQVLAADAAGAQIWRVDSESLTDEGSREIERAVTGFQPHRGDASVRQGALRLTARRQGTLAAVSTVTMRFSDDGGRTWSRTFEVVLRETDVTKRIEFRSLGRIRSPGRIWEIEDRGGLVRIDGADSDLDGE